MGLQPVQEHPRRILDEADQMVVVLAGEISSDPAKALPLQEFLDAGGRVLIATDRGGKVSVTGGYISQLNPGPVLVGPAFEYQDFADCPVIEGDLLSADHPLTAGVRRLICNRPGYLTVSANSTGPLIRFPAGATADQPLTARDGLAAAVDVAASGGRAMWIADHSIYVNEMLRHGDNARFMFNTLGWLTEGGQRRKLILIQDGMVLSAVNFNHPAIPPIPLDELAQNLPTPSAELLRALANDAIIAAEDEDLPNQLLRNRPHDMRINDLRRAFITAVVFFLIVVFVMQLFVTGRPLGPLSVRGTGGAGRTKGVAHPAMAAAAIATDDVWKPPTEQLLRGGTIPRTARTLAQQCLLALSDPPPVDPNWQQSQCPALVTTQPFYRRRRLNWTVRQLWQIASGQIAPVRHHRQLQKLTEQLTWLKQLHKNQQIRLKWS